MRSTPFAALILVSLLAPVTSGAQYEDHVQQWLRSCEGKWNNDRARFCEVRSVTMRPESKITVDGRENGSVAFHGWDQNEVKVVAMIQTHSDDDRDAEVLAKQIRINTSGGRISAEGPSPERRTGWSVSYDVYVPMRSNLQAVTRNGGVSAEDIEGDLDFEAQNGGISVEDVAGDVRGETTNGGINARLSGRSWRGRGLNLRTTNGGVNLTIPRDYNASLETGTTNGGMRIDFPITVQGLIGKRIRTQLGSGGPLVSVTTTNGGVKVSQR
jgi:DUF4097 and DUF4098 domain-containing protein YvlB